jgi:hypothetical protein
MVMHHVLFGSLMGNLRGFGVRKFPRDHLFWAAFPWMSISRTSFFIIGVVGEWAKEGQFLAAGSDPLSFPLLRRGDIAVRVVAALVGAEDPLQMALDAVEDQQGLVVGVLAVIA